MEVTAKNVRLAPLEIGWADAEARVMCRQMPGRVRFPFTSWLVLHPKGTVLFDTGLHDSLIQDASRIGALADLMSIDMSFTLAEVIDRAGIVDAADIDYVVFSHLHFDHSGGTMHVPNARLIVQESEWTAAHTPKLIERGVYDPDEFDLGHDVIQVRGEHDVFGDGTVVCLPTPGHTPGHQCLQLSLASGPHLLVGDCCNFASMLEDELLPANAYNPELQIESMRTLLRLQRKGARLVYSHDPYQWAALRDTVIE